MHKVTASFKPARPPMRLIANTPAIPFWTLLRLSLPLVCAPVDLFSS